MPDCTLSEATPDRATEIASLYVRTRRLAYAPFFPADVLAAMSVPAEAERWAQRLAAEHARCLLVVARDGSIAGFTHIRWDEEPGEVEFVYVATERQGKGIGAKLMVEAESRLRDAGCEAAVLWVYSENLPARRFYELCGWQSDGAERASDSAPGKFLFRYRKQLRS